MHQKRDINYGTILLTMGSKITQDYEAIYNNKEAKLTIQIDRTVARSR